MLFVGASMGGVKGGWDFRERIMMKQVGLGLIMESWF